MKLDLKGLKIVWIGLLLSIAGSVCSSSGGRNAVQNVADLTVTETTARAGLPSTIGAILAIVAFILVVVGLSRLKNVSPYFKKARNLQIVLLILAIVFVIVFAVLIVAAVIGTGAEIGSESFVPELGDALIVLAAALIVFLILLMIFAVLYNTNLLKGCQQTAKICEDHSLAEQFRKMRKTYIIAIVLVVAGAIVMVGSVVAFAAAAASGYAIGDSNAQILIALIPGAVLMAIGGIIMIIYMILLLVRMALLWKYDGKEITQQTMEV